MQESDVIRATHNRMAEKYHAKRLNPAASQWNDLLESPGMERLLRPLCPGRRALDLGCGTGILTRRLIEWGATVCGVDPAERMLAIANELLSNVEFKLGSATPIPYPDASFDVVASSLALHYIQQLDPVFAEVARVLRPNGHFVFSMHHPFEETFSMDGNAEGSPRIRPYFSNDPYTWEMCGEQILSYHHTLGDIVNGLGASGFSLLAVDECAPAPESAEYFSAYAYTSQHPPFCAFRAQRTA